MQKQTRYNFTPVHMNLLQQVFSLSKKQNLCSNNYLYRQINQNFELPFNIITEERKIAQISHNSQTIQEALQMCNLIQLIDDNTVRIHEFPTLKIGYQHKSKVEELSKILKQKNKKVLVYEEDNDIFLSLLQIKANKQLENLVQEFDKNLEYKITDLHADWKIGTGKIRKLKQQRKNYKHEKYSFDKPPGIFIRRAVESSDEEQETLNNKKYTNHKKDEKQKQKQKEKEKQKKYRQKPIINEQDFPILT